MTKPEAVPVNNAPRIAAIARQHLSFLLDDFGGDHDTPEEKIAPDARIAQVKLDWKPEWWADVLNGEGAYLSRCCGRISRVRERLSFALCHGGWLSTHHLTTMMTDLMGHSWDDLITGPFEAISVDDPVTDLIRIHHLINGVQVVDQEPATALDPNTIEDALCVLSRRYANEQLGDLLTLRDTGKKIRLIAGLLPAVRTVHAYLTNLAPGTSEGYAIVQRDRPTAVFKTLAGLTLYTTVTEAEEVIGYWSTSDPTIRERVRIRPYCASLAAGLQFLDTE